MANLISRNALTLSTLVLGVTTLSACSAQSYGHGTAFAGENCNTAISQACGGRYGTASYGAGSYGAYGGQYSAHSGANFHGQKSRYGTSYQVAGYNEQYYAQQQYMQQPQMMLRPAPYAQPSYSYQTAETTYQEPALNVELYDQPTATPTSCPAGTTAQSDGTCLQGSSISSYTSSYSTPTTPSYSSGYITSGSALNCPAGTTASSDGTCLQGGSSYTSTPSSTSYTSSSSSSVAPSIGTYDFGDYNWGSKDTTWGTDGYVSPGSRVVDAPNNYPAAPSSPSGYMPSRK